MQFAEAASNEDIERELFQLGLSDSPPRAHRKHSEGALSECFTLPWHDSFRLSNPTDDRRSISNVGTFANDYVRGIRSSSAPANHFERPYGINEQSSYNLSYNGWENHPRSRKRLSRNSLTTRSLNDIQQGRSRSLSHSGVTQAAAARKNTRRNSHNVVPNVLYSVNDPAGVHYPGYVQLQDFTTLPRETREVGGDISYYNEDREAKLEKELVARVEAMLRMVHAGIQESYIHYEHSDTDQEPPPPQPMAACLKDPPPSPEPSHVIETPPKPCYNGAPVERIPATSTAIAPQATSGFIGPPRLVGPDSASILLQKVGFRPIQESPPKSSVAEHDKGHHRHHRYHKNQKQQPQNQISSHSQNQMHSASHQQPHEDHFHSHHQRKRSSRALRRIKNIAAIARGSGIKKVRIKRDVNWGSGYGFSIKGSLEAGLGVYVSRVEEKSPGWAAGLRAGDLLLSANGQVVSQMDHTEMISLLKSSDEISLTLAATSQMTSSEAPSPTNTLSESYSWVTPDGEPTSQPADYNPRLHRQQVSKVKVSMSGTNGLGLMIRGGAEYGLGIFVTGVDKGSAADKAGLQVGDQILEVNGKNFLSITHDTAVSVLKFAKWLQVSFWRIGKLPYSCTTYKHKLRTQQARSDVCSPPALPAPPAVSLGSTLAMIEQKSQSLLSPQHHNYIQTMVTDYVKGFIRLEDLLAGASQVLNSPHKLSLLTELREIIRQEDLRKFDSVVFEPSSSLSIAHAPSFSTIRHPH